MKLIALEGTVMYTAMISTICGHPPPSDQCNLCPIGRGARAQSCPVICSAVNDCVGRRQPAQATCCKPVRHLPHELSCCQGLHRHPVPPSLARASEHALACRTTCSAPRTEDLSRIHPTSLLQLPHEEIAHKQPVISVALGCHSWQRCD